MPNKEGSYFCFQRLSLMLQATTKQHYINKQQHYKQTQPPNRFHTTVIVSSGFTQTTDKLITSQPANSITLIQHQQISKLCRSGKNFNEEQKTTEKSIFGLY